MLKKEKVTPNRQINSICVLGGSKYPQDLLFPAFHRSGGGADYKPKTLFLQPTSFAGA